MDDLDVAADVATARPRNCAPELEVIAVTCGVCRKLGIETGSGVATAWRQRRRRTERTRSTSTKGVTRIAPASTTTTVTAATRAMATAPTKARAGTHRQKARENRRGHEDPDRDEGDAFKDVRRRGELGLVARVAHAGAVRRKGPDEVGCRCGSIRSRSPFSAWCVRQLAGTAGADSYEPPRGCRQIGPAALSRLCEQLRSAGGAPQHGCARD